MTAAIIFTIMKNKSKTKEIFIEKHVKLKNSKGQDAETSITVKELVDMIFYLRNIERAIFH